jgi:MFS transporter, PPP family, 3-phenylpropionic acid transporter
MALTAFFAGCGSEFPGTARSPAMATCLPTDGWIMHYIFFHIHIKKHLLPNQTKRGLPMNSVTKRRTLLSITLVYFLAYFALGAFSTLFGVYLKEEIQLSGTQTGLILSIGPIVMLFTQPLWGFLSDYTRKPRQLLMLSIIVTGLLGLLFLFFDRYFLIFAAAILLAVFQAAINPLTDSLTLNYTSKNGLNYGRFRLWGAAGFAFAAWVSGTLAEMFGLKVIFFAFAFSLWISAIFAWFMPREGEFRRAEVGKGLVKLMRMPRFLIFLTASFCVMGPLLAHNSYFGLYYQAIGGTVAGVGFCFLLGAGSEIPIWNTSGKWIEKHGPHLMAICAGVIGAIRWFFYSFDLPLAWVIILTLTQGLTIGIFFPASLIYIQSVAPPEVRTTAVSLNAAMTSGLGNWFFVLIGGMILDAFGIFSVYRFFSLFTFIGVILIAGLALTKKNPPSTELAAKEE